jgi:hypothetical protein
MFINKLFGTLYFRKNIKKVGQHVRPDERKEC